MRIIQNCLIFYVFFIKVANPNDMYWKISWHSGKIAVRIFCSNLFTSIAELLLQQLKTSLASDRCAFLFHGEQVSPCPFTLDLMVQFIHVVRQRQKDRFRFYILRPAA